MTKLEQFLSLFFEKSLTKRVNNTTEIRRVKKDLYFIFKNRLNLDPVPSELEILKTFESMGFELFLKEGMIDKKLGYKQSKANKISSNEYENETCKTKHYYVMFKPNIMNILKLVGKKYPNISSTKREEIEKIESKLIRIS